MIAQHPHARSVLRNWAIASIIALTTTLAPIVRTDTIRFVRTVFAGNQPATLVRVDVTK